MKEWNNIYNRNKKLDEIFFKEYGNTIEIYNKNCVELLTELGEFANETKCFKYWSIKEPNKEELLEEYADCIIMTLYFHNYFNLEIQAIKIDEDKDIIELFNYLFEQSAKLMHNSSKELVIDIFNNLLYMGKLLKFTDQEIYDSCDKKIKKVEERFNYEY